MALWELRGKANEGADSQRVQGKKLAAEEEAGERGSVSRSSVAIKAVSGMIGSATKD
jgi:hypothetical protein